MQEITRLYTVLLSRVHYLEREFAQMCCLHVKDLLPSFCDSAVCLQITDAFSTEAQRLHKNAKQHYDQVAASLKNTQAAVQQVSLFSKAANEWSIWPVLAFIAICRGKSMYRRPSLECTVTIGLPGKPIYKGMPNDLLPRLMVEVCVVLAPDVNFFLNSRNQGIPC